MKKERRYFTSFNESSNDLFPSFMSEPYLSTRSMTYMHLKKFKVFSSLQRPETHFRHAQGHQRASAPTGSINIFQSTTITVYEVEYQKTVNTTQTWKTDYLVFRSNQRVSPLLPRKARWKTKKAEKKVALLSKSLSIDIIKSHN